MGVENKKVLITSGPTWVEIDDMRVISNRSTGRLGGIIAKDFFNRGSKVTVLEGPVLNRLDSVAGIKVLKFYFYDELFQLIRKELRKGYDIVVHVAAVSDYKLRSPFKGKMSSGQESIILELVPTEKIIDSIKRIAPNVFLVGFKLEPNMHKVDARREASSLIRRAGCDLVIANTNDIRGYRAYIINKDGDILAFRKSRYTLSRTLVRLLDGMI